MHNIRSISIVYLLFLHCVNMCMLLFLDLYSHNIDPVIDYIHGHDIAVVSIFPVIYRDRDLYIVIVDCPPWQAVWITLLAS